MGRKAWLFAGSERGGERAAIMYTLIQTAKLNGVDPQAWLADVLARIANHSITSLTALLPWHSTEGVAVSMRQHLPVLENDALVPDSFVTVVAFVFAG